MSGMMSAAAGANRKAMSTRGNRAGKRKDETNDLAAIFSKESPTQMQKLRLLVPILGALFLFAAPARLSAQAASHLEFGGDYNYLHANAPPGGCGCFSAMGGDGWIGFRATKELSIVGEFASQSASNISGTPASIRMYTFMGGPRFTIRSRRRLMPFGKTYAGIAHASGDLVPNNSGLPSSANVLAFSVGGGADFAISSSLSIRLIDVDYLYTRFNNGTNDHQNNVRLAAGIVIRLGNN
jgi:outer membrane immunogenic protein